MKKHGKQKKGEYGTTTTEKYEKKLTYVENENKNTGNIRKKRETNRGKNTTPD